MPICQNLTRFVVDEFAGHDHKGREFYTVILKATFEWSDYGDVMLASEQQPILPIDVYAGDPAVSGPIQPTDFAPTKPLVDFLLIGGIALPTPVEEVDVTVQVGRRLKKTVRVFGDRMWLPAVASTLSLSRPQPFSEMPIEWDRSFGGHDPEHPELYEARNPIGRGMRKEPHSLEGQLAPNFEDPRALITSWSSKPAPIGFGPVAPFWQPRVTHAGTYDEKWKEEVFPLLPDDFDERYFNCAPLDQQFPEYPVGEDVSLHYSTETRRDRFTLPPLQVPVLIVLPRGRSTVETLTPDTILINPAARRLILAGRVKYLPRPDIAAIRQVLVGELTPGRWRALQTGKEYIDLRRLPSS
jgi:hypothetical protein